MTDFVLKEIQSIADFNPVEKLPIGTTAKSIPMAMLKEFQRKIIGYEIAEFKSGSKFRNGDVLVAKITPCLENGKTAFVDILENDEIAFGSTEFIVLRAKDNTDKDFLYYFSRSPAFRKKAIGCMEGTSGRKRVNENSLRMLELPIPSLPIQKKIASVLSTLDEKIALNNQINATLEQMAKTLYDYWFVQFDFPDDNGKPYKSSGGEMVYNETLKRDIPKGWEVQNLSHHLKCNEKKLGKNHSLPFINYLDTSSLTNNQLSEAIHLVVGKDEIPSRANMVISHNDILYSTVRPNQNHFGFIKNPLENFIASTGFAVLSHKNNPNLNSIFYLFLTSDKNNKKLIRISETATSAYPSISPKDILNLQIALPSDNKDLIKMAEVFDSNFSKISINQKENQELTKLRDWLLPMLMNGQVTVQ